MRFHISLALCNQKGNLYKYLLGNCSISGATGTHDYPNLHSTPSIMGIQSQPQTEETSPEVSSPSSTTANSQTQTNETSPEVSPPSPTTRNTTKLRAQEISRLYSNENLPWNIYLLLLVNRENAQQSYAALRDLGDKKIPKWYLQQRNAYIQAIAVTVSTLFVPPT